MPLNLAEFQKDLPGLEDTKFWAVVRMVSQEARVRKVQARTAGPKFKVGDRVVFKNRKGLVIHGAVEKVFRTYYRVFADRIEENGGVRLPAGKDEGRYRVHISLLSPEEGGIPALLTVKEAPKQDLGESVP